MIGEKYGRLTVVRLSHRDGRHRKWWDCVCDCGGSATLHTGNLRSGNTKSCGCLIKDSAALRRIPNAHSEITAVILSYKRHAMARGLEWQLSRNDASGLMRMPCHYCGGAPSNVMVTKNTVTPFKYSGIDRVDNKAGYIIGNVVPACKICNIAKRDLTLVEFAEWARRLGAMADQWGWLPCAERAAA